MCVCVACVANQWCWGGDGVMAMGPLVREGEGEWRVTAGDDRYGNNVTVRSHMEVKGERGRQR